MTAAARVDRLARGTAVATDAPGAKPTTDEPWADPLRQIAREHRRRRLAALAVMVTALFDLIAAALPPRPHLGFVHFAPLVVAQGATALLALAGLLLLATVRGLRRGQRRAWAFSVALLGVTGLLHLVRGVGVVQVGCCLTALAVLVACRRSFAACTDPRSSRSGGLWLVAGLLAGIASTAASVEIFYAADRDGGQAPHLTTILLAVTERLVDIRTIPFPLHLDRFLTPALAAMGVALFVSAVLLTTRPLVDRSRRGSDESMQRARHLVDRHGGGTLDYFALRDDKRHYFTHDTVVSYAVHHGICLVSPDPIGPAEQAVEAWAEFSRFADQQGWPVAVLGGDAAWLPIYRRSGMRALYVGDEAIVPVDDFSLSGGHKKGLRQAVNRIAKYGYTMSFHDPCHLDPAMAEALRDLADQGRRGHAERGFSMTLGRLFDPDDTGLLLAVASDRDGRPVALCQFVPAPSIGGYSLDLMRREEGGHPNGLVDFVLVSTIEHLRASGMAGLGLNFATMRALVADDTPSPAGHRLVRWALRKLSRSMQIESLWRFCAKYDPEWVSRYLVTGSLEQFVSIGLAVAQAESFWELPVIGRFLSRSTKDCSSSRPAPAPAHPDPGPVEAFDGSPSGSRT